MFKERVKHNFMYMHVKGKYYMCDTDLCGESERTFDVAVYTLSNNRDLLRLLNLYYIEYTHGMLKCSNKERFEWFCGYLSAFKDEDKLQLVYEKLLKNPTVRVLIEDEELLNDIKNLISQLEKDKLPEVVIPQDGSDIKMLREIVKSTRNKWKS